MLGERRTYRLPASHGAQLLGKYRSLSFLINALVAANVVAAAKVSPSITGDSGLETLEDSS